MLKSADCLDGGTDDAKPFQTFARCGHRSVNIDASACILDNDDREALAMCVLSGVAHAKIKGESG